MNSATLTLVAGLLGLWTAGAAAADVMQVLRFKEFEPGVGEYPSRMLITEDYLRFDDDADAGDFVLFDRHSGVITSVSHGRRSRFEIHPRDVPMRIPAALKPVPETRERPADSEGGFAGKPRWSVRFLVGDQVCGGAEVVAGWNETVRSAVLAYFRAIESNNAADLDKTPEDLRGGCFYADNFALRTDSLELGFPVVMWRADGRRRVLVEHHEVAADPGLFRLPDYRPYSFSTPAAGD